MWSFDLVHTKCTKCNTILMYLTNQSLFTNVITCELQSRSPLRCLWSFWTCWDISYKSSGSNPLHHLKSTRHKLLRHWTVIMFHSPVVGVYSPVTTYHVGLPTLHVNTAIDTPPEVILWFALPGKHWETCQTRHTGVDQDRKVYNRIM